MKIVCLGDSLTAGYGVCQTDCWVSLAAEETQYTWINSGICGDTTGGMLARLTADVFSHSPDCVVLMGGSNDIFIAGSWNWAKANIMAMVHQSVANNIRPVIGIPIPLSPNTTQPQRKSFLDYRSAAEEIQAYSDWLRFLCADLQLRILDFGKVFEACFSEYDSPSLYLPDGIHPSVEGHRIMAEAAVKLKLSHRS